MMLNRSTFPLSLVACGCLFSSSAVMAQAVNFTINGMINEVACTPTMSGTGVSGNAITLPNVNLSQLDAANKIAGQRTVKFSVANCGASTAVNNMWVHFTGNGGVTAGRIHTNNPNVKIEVRDGPSGDVQVRVGGTAGATGPGANQGTGAALTGTYPSRAGDKEYRFMYYASAPVTAAGSITASGTYTVKFY